MATKTHIWVGNKSGMVTSTVSDDKKPNCPVKKSKEKLKYLGYTQTLNVKWPKLQSTGRLLHKPKETPSIKNH